MLSDKTPEYIYWVFHTYHITLTEHVKKKPVANITLFDNCVDYFPSYESETYVKEIRPHFWTYYDNEAVDDDEEAEHCE